MLAIDHCGIPKLQQRSSASVADALHVRLPSRVAVLFLCSCSRSSTWLRLDPFEKAPKDMARVKDVRYDLVIAREHDGAPVEITYRRDRLPSNAHTIETALKPETRYFWSVRARFLLDGRERVTEWAADTFMERGIVTAPEIETAPSIRSYRFSTP